MFGLKNIIMLNRNDYDNKVLTKRFFTKGGKPLGFSP
jgi:hypothetical protein